MEGGCTVTVRLGDGTDQRCRWPRHHPNTLGGWDQATTKALRASLGIPEVRMVGEIITKIRGLELISDIRQLTSLLGHVLHE